MKYDIQSSCVHTRAKTVCFSEISGPVATKSVVGPSSRCDEVWADEVVGKPPKDRTVHHILLL